MFKQVFKQQLSPKITPQQIQIAKLTVLPIHSFEQKVHKELEENPALIDVNKISDSDTGNSDANQNTPTNYPTKATNYSSGTSSNIYDTSEISLLEHLRTQLSSFSLNEEQYTIAKFLIGSIDSNGYLVSSLPEILEDLAFIEKVYPLEDVTQKIIYIIQSLEPAGVGAKDLQECLLIQLQRRKQTKQVLLAIKILEDGFDAFSKKKHEELINKFDLTPENLKQAIQEILSLNPKPGSIFSKNRLSTSQIIPDFSLTITDDVLEFALNDRNAPELYISKDFEQMLKRYKASTKRFKEQKQTVQFLQTQLDSAKEFINAIAQRKKTLCITMGAIMHYQKEYFLSGDKGLLKPMILKDIANIIEMDISTISRVVSSKYVETPYGIKLLKEFFSESTTNIKGEEVSINKVKEILKNIIAEERTPYTDQQLVTLLQEKGYEIPRRRIATYREQLNILTARLRKKL